jgi:hypothetical protein
MRPITALLLLACFGEAQSLERHRFTLDGGLAQQVVSPSDSAPALGLTYGYLLKPYLELEAGLFTGLNPGPELRGAHYDFQSYDRYFWTPFGVRFVAPLRRNRVELAGGGGGIYQKYSSEAFDAGRNGWGGYFVASASAALDRRRHFWLGAAPHLFLISRDFGHDRWLLITGELSIRF